MTKIDDFWGFLNESYSRLSVDPGPPLPLRFADPISGPEFLTKFGKRHFFEGSQPSRTDPTPQEGVWGPILTHFHPESSEIDHFLSIFAIFWPFLGVWPSGGGSGDPQERVYLDPREGNADPREGLSHKITGLLKFNAVEHLTILEFECRATEKDGVFSLICMSD